MTRKSNLHPLVWGFNRYTIFSVYINRIKHKELHTNNEKLSTACTNWSSKGSVEKKKKNTTMTSSYHIYNENKRRQVLKGNHIFHAQFPIADTDNLTEEYTI